MHMLLKIPQILFVGGKGGVGKSTISSALAFALSLKGAKVLLISTDPAHNLGDIFDMKFSSIPAQISPNLSVIEIDPQVAAQNYVKKVAKNAKNFVSANGYAQVDDYFKRVSESSSAAEAALFEHLSEILTSKLNEFDHIIIDTAPTGHTLRLFFMPKILKDWSKNLLSMQERSSLNEGILGHLSRNSDEKSANLRTKLIELLEERYLRYCAFSNLIKSPKCGILLVLNANKLAINETSRAIENLATHDLKPFCMVLNKILPPNSNDEFLSARISQENLHAAAARAKFSPLIEMPLFKNDITEREILKEFGETLLAKFENLS